MLDANAPWLKVGDKVCKWRGDYVFQGRVVAVFRKRDGATVRVCVENRDGLIHIFNQRQLARMVEGEHETVIEHYPPEKPPCR